MWFIYAVVTLLFWAVADLFYKLGNKEGDNYSHLKTGIMVGLVMGIHATIYLILNGISFSFIDLIDEEYIFPNLVLNRNHHNLYFVIFVQL